MGQGDKVMSTETALNASTTHVLRRHVLNRKVNFQEAKRLIGRNRAATSEVIKAEEVM